MSHNIFLDGVNFPNISENCIIITVVIIFFFYVTFLFNTDVPYMFTTTLIQPKRDYIKYGNFAISIYNKYDICFCLTCIATTLRFFFSK